MMRKYPYPCDGCMQPDCDYRHCDRYRAWFCDSWNDFHRHACHNYWEESPQPGDKLCYVHPDVLRRYLAQGPCERCACGDCVVPCKRYRQWWDARIVWFKWKLQHPPFHAEGGHIYDTNSASFAIKSLFLGHSEVSGKYCFHTSSLRRA